MNELQTRPTPPPDFRGAPADPAMTARGLAQILWRRFWLIALLVAASTLTAAFISARTPKAWRANAQLLLVQRAPVMLSTPEAVTGSPMVESVDTQITLLQSRALAQQAARSVGASAEALQGATTIVPNKDGDNVIDVAVVAGSRDQAVAWANALCDTFVAFKNGVSKSDSGQDIHNLRVLAQQAQKQMDAADSRLHEYQTTHRIGDVSVLDPQAQQTAALAAITAQDGVVAGLRTENDAAQSRDQALQAQVARGKAAIESGPGIVRDDPQVIKIQEHLQDLQSQQFQALQKYPRTAPTLGPGQILLAQLAGQIADTKAKLQQAIHASQSQPSLDAQNALEQASAGAHSDAVAAAVKLAAAERQDAALRQQTADLPGISLDAGRLIAASKQAHDLYSSISARMNAAELDNNVASGNVQIFQPAYAPDAPFRPDHKRDLLMGFAVGLCLALLAVLLLEQADGAVRTSADVRRLAEGPVVAVLPQMSRAERGQFAGGNTPPHLVETYNAARANLALAMRQRTGSDLDNHQVILVTSALPGEGKSLTASELAQSFARAGRRVALINADMRRPSPLMPGAKDSARAAGPGLAEVLAGEAGVEDALTQTGTPCLSVMHGGKAAQNPMDLISQPRMAEAMQTLRALADVVIVDSPPASVVADALLLAPHADCVLYVVGVGMVGSENVRHTAAALAAASPKMLAYFVNRVPRLSAEPTSYSYGGYGRPAAAPPDAGEYRSNRTIQMERLPLPEQGAVVTPTPDLSGGANGSGAHGGDLNGFGHGSRSSLRILPKIGSALVAMEGPYVGQSFALSPSKPLTLGTRPDSDIVLARDETISQVHAHITPEDGGYTVYDDSSTNGTLVNDLPVSRHPLQVGDVLQLGASTFRYE